jgi:hypothetical protein
MPLFFFDYGDDDDGFEPDESGIEFPNIEATYVDAYHAAIDMWAEAGHGGHDLSRHRFEIRDASGRIILELPFSEVLGEKETPPRSAIR